MDKDTFQQEVYNVVRNPSGAGGDVRTDSLSCRKTSMFAHGGTCYARCARRHVSALPSGSEQPGQAGTVLGGTAGFAGGRGRDVQKEWVCGHEKMPVGIHERANTIRL